MRRFQGKREGPAERGGRWVITFTGVLIALCVLGSCRPPKSVPREIVLSVPWDVETLDPHRRDRIGEVNIASHFYEALVQMDPDLGIRPCLATRWINPDLLTWVFTLRPSVRFHDGSVLTANDVVWSFRRVLGDTSLDVGFYALQIESVRALDPSTIEIRTKKPLGILLNKIAVVHIIPHGTSGADLEKNPNGTGPYRFAGWKPGGQLEMRRNEMYWGGSKPLRRATFLLKRSSEEAVQDLLSGKSQFAQGSARTIDSAVRREQGLKQASQTGLFLKFLGFDFSKQKNRYVSKTPNPFLKTSVRKAVSLAIDRKKLVLELGILASPASQVVPPSVFGFNSSLPELEYDPGRAQQLLKDAGYPSGFDVTLHTRTIFGDPARMVAAMLTAVGIRVQVLEMSEQDFFRLVRTPTSAFFLTRFGCSTGDASDVLDAVIHSTDPSSHFGEANIGGYSNPEIDREIQESAEILTVPSRAIQLHEIMAHVMSEMVLVPLFFDQDVYAFRPAYVWRPRADSAILASEIGVE